MRNFTRSQYGNDLDLYKSKAEYYEKLFKLCVGMLVEAEDVYYNEDGQYYFHAHTGERLDEFI